jgi:hypothetical protein
LLRKNVAKGISTRIPSNIACMEKSNQVLHIRETKDRLIGISVLNP